MPNTWNELSWAELQRFDQASPRERNTDSSVAAQYEDHIPPDSTWQHEDES